ncbi:tetratricopeptide repeat protein, partial [Oxynema sp. CENA135]|uniref:tetratricopeptide repeat protein n=1 Tax=Oxynema sp. CENA135 TaxID=984206 RepID=UPI00190BECED
MSTPTPQEQVAALQEQLIQIRKRGDRTESRQDNRPAESEILGKLGIAYYQNQQWHSALTTLTEYLNLARELGNQTNEAVAHYYLGFTQQAIAEFEQAVAAFFQGYRLFRQLQQHEFAAQPWQQLVQQGQRYLQNQQVPEAVALYKRQIQVLLEFDDLKASAEIAVELGKLYYSQPDFPQAIACFTSALDTAQTLKDQTLENVALAWLGCSHWQGGDLSQGLQYLEQRLALVQQLENTAAQQETLTWLIQISQQLNHPDKLIQSYQLQANFWQQQGEPVNQHLSLYELAIYQFNRQHYPEALSGFQVALELANTLNDDQGKSWKTANNNYMLGECYRNLGENQAAISPYQQAVDLYGQLGAKEWAEKGLENLLTLYRELQQAEPEIDCQKKRFQLIQDKGEDIKAQSLAYEIGNLYNRRQQFIQALEYYQEALILAKKLEQPQNLANAAYMVGQCYRNLGQEQAAISPYQQAVELYLQVGVKEWAEKGLEHLLNLYRELQQLEQEIDCQKKRFQLIQDKGEDIKAQSLAYEIGNLYNRRQQFTQALEYYQEALILAKKLEQQKNIANAAYMVGQCYRNLGQQQAAISGYEQAVGLYVEVKETKWALSGLDYLVNLYRELKQDEQVIASYQRQLEIFRELGDTKAEQSCLYKIGSLYDDLKQWENALEYFDLALSLAQKLELKHSQANAHYMQGQCCRNLVQQQAAISGYEQAVELYVEVKETKWALLGLDYLVNLYRELGQYEGAIGSYQGRLEIFRELADRTSEHSCLYDLASFQFNTQKYQDALSGFEAALQIAETLTEDSNQTYKLANSRYMMGQCCRNLGQAQAAIAHYQQATGLYIELGVKDWAAKALDYQGTLQKELNNYEQALAAQEQRLGLLQELNETASKQSCLYNIGCILNYQKQWTRALEYFGQALSLAVELEQNQHEANAHYMLAQCHESIGDFHLAEESTQRAKNLYQSLGDDEWEEICQNSLSRLASKANLSPRSRFGQDLNTGQRIQQALQQFWLQLLQAEMQNGGDEAAVHQVMRQNMELIVPALGDSIAQWMQDFVTQDPDLAEGVAGVVENTCTRIRLFPDGRYGEALAIAIRGYDVVLALRADNPGKRAQTLTNLGTAYSIQAQLGLDPATNLDHAITAYTEAATIRRRSGLEKDLSGTLTNLGNTY